MTRWVERTQTRSVQARIIIEATVHLRSSRRVWSAECWVQVKETLDLLRTLIRDSLIAPQNRSRISSMDQEITFLREALKMQPTIMIP